MNLVLFELAELPAPLLRTDARAIHVITVLRRGEGDTFDAGIINGPQGKATLISITPIALTLAFIWNSPAPFPPATTLIIGLPRPQTARDILRDATTLGATCIHFVSTERADPNYSTSTLWTSGEWRRHCVAGATQAFDTHIPEITWNHTLTTILATLPTPIPTPEYRLALDNYQASAPLQVCRPSVKPPSTPAALLIAIGPERGFGPKDRALLIANGFTLTHLGSRVLRVETAVIAALAITRAG